jgi:hypothetical protein
MGIRGSVLLGLAAVAPATPIVWVTQCYAQHFLSVEQAQAVLFPEANRFEAADITLSSEQRERIKEISDVKVARGELKVFKAYRDAELLGQILIDHVIGKHLLIDYAVAVTSARTVKQIEILEYRENYGGEVARQEWRQNFVGKSSKDALKLRKDIPNISGATYSTLHVTEGVRRLLATLDVVEGAVSHG